MSLNKYSGIKFGLPSTIMADCCTQCISEVFKQRFWHQNNLQFSVPFPVKQRCRTINRKIALKGRTRKNLKTSVIWMPRSTLIDSSTPSPYELLFGRKPRQILPSSNQALASHHPNAKIIRMPMSSPADPSVSRQPQSVERPPPTSTWRTS